jgi:hypothetical protein
MNKLTKIKKYEKALECILFCVEHNPKVSLNKMQKELKINSNFISALSKLGIIKNNGIKGTSNYVLLKKYSPELALEVLNYANDRSMNKKQTIIEKHVGKIEPEAKKTFLQRIFEFFKF